MPAYRSQCLPLSTGFWYFLIFPNLLGIISLQCCFPCFGSLGVQVASGGVVMTHSTAQQLFIPPGLQIIHIYASGSRLFSCMSAIVQVDQSHLSHRAQGISTSSRAEVFLFGCPCQGTAGEGCKDREAESADMAGRQTQNGEKALGICRNPGGATNREHLRSAVNGRNHTGAWSKPR